MILRVDIDLGVAADGTPAGLNTLHCAGRNWPEGFFRPGQYAVMVGGQVRDIHGNSDRVLVIEGGWADDVPRGAGYSIWKKGA